MASRAVDRGRVIVVVAAVASLGGCEAPGDDAEAGAPGADGSARPAAGALAAVAGTAAPPGPGRLAIGAPIRVEDLRPGHYPAINQNNGLWHDINVVRFDEDAKVWTGMQAGGTTEFDQLDWDVPVYSGVDGEVIACWRNNPFDPDYQNELQEGGGNFIVIRTDDGRYVFYAHLQTNSIPYKLCPNESDSGWYSDPGDYFPDGCPGGFHGVVAESYVEEWQRARIDRGQFVGRIGGHGRASGPHLHVHAGNVAVVGDGAPCISNARYELDFDDGWYQAGGVAPYVLPWMPASEANIAVVAQSTFVRMWPSYRHEATYGEPPRLGEFGEPTFFPRDDLLCHDVKTGTLWIDYADEEGYFEGTDWKSSEDFCSAEHLRLHKGDFDGDGRGDLLCHDLVGGQRSVMYAQKLLGFEEAEVHVQAVGWCEREGDRLWVGDFDGDGKDDLLCHDLLGGELEVDFSAPGAGDMVEVPFHGTDVVAGPWCLAYSERLHVGDFDGDGRDDLLCHDVLGGQLWVDLAGGVEVFGGADFERDDAHWCREGGQLMYVGDFDGDGRDDLLCHDSDDGDMEIRLARGEGPLLPLVLDWFHDDGGWCTGPERRLLVGDVGGDERDDLVCHDQKTGQRWVDVMAPIIDKTTGGFEGTDWSDAGSWCWKETQGVH